jgi:dimethylargininase
VAHAEVILKERFECLERIDPPGTLEGGDILQIGKHFFIGISSRTNREGASQLSSILQKYGYTSSVIELVKFFHLKTGVSTFGENRILVADELIEHLEFEKFEKIIVPSEEVYCANSLRINDSFLMPAGFPHTQEKVASLCKTLGLQLKILDLSEFQKMDGGASCLSLRF